MPENASAERKKKFCTKRKLWFSNMMLTLCIHIKRILHLVIYCNRKKRERSEKKTKYFRCDGIFMGSHRLTSEQITLDGFWYMPIIIWNLCDDDDDDDVVDGKCQTIYKWCTFSAIAFSFSRCVCVVQLCMWNICLLKKQKWTGKFTSERLREWNRTLQEFQHDVQIPYALLLSSTHTHTYSHVGLLSSSSSSFPRIT